MAGGSGLRTDSVAAAGDRLEQTTTFDGMIGNTGYKYRTISIEQLHKIRKDFRGLIDTGTLSSNVQYREYLNQLMADVQESLPEARSVIVLARATWMAQAWFHFFDRKFLVLLPPQYFDDGIKRDLVQETARRDLVGEGFRLEPARGLPAKTLAVRSGLGRYGRNNLCYIDGMGSYAALYCFLTDKEFDQGGLAAASVMEACHDCQACRINCPTGSIGEERFVIDAGRCLSLYNEGEGQVPDWIAPGSHHALFGCLRCQMSCPANRGIEAGPRQFEDVIHEETEELISGKIEPKTAEEVARKLHLISGEYVRQIMPVLSRNLRLASDARKAG